MENTDRRYERSQGRKPRGTGGWMFQMSSSNTAFDREMFGEMFSCFGTFGEARKAARKNFAGQSGYCATME